MAGNSNLNDSARNKQDEFYTQLSLIESELKHYKQHFKGKVVLCNCDDPYESNFFKYFAMNFNSWGLKKLITTCYATSPVVGEEMQYFFDKDGQLFFEERSGGIPVQKDSKEKRPYKVEITEVTDENGDGRIDLADVEYLKRNKKNIMTMLDGDGDFRSGECEELLKQSDIVVTNPPFSLFREYIALLVKYEKQFLIIGKLNTVKYKEILPLFMTDKVWLGCSRGRPMKIELHEIPVRDVVAGYKDSAENGVVGYGGRLDIRPAFQREFIYKDKQRDEVINTVRKEFPLNVMYWAKTDGGEFEYEMLDGQQRTISICQYVAGDYSINHLTFDNLTKTEQEQIYDYKLMVYICEGTDKEKLDWFKIINIAGEELTAQELRNAIYTGEWLTEAKKYFSKPQCPAYQIAGDYLSGSAIRQSYLETAIKWIAARDGIEIEDYMSQHQHDTNCNELCCFVLLESLCKICSAVTCDISDVMEFAENEPT